jgi:hypothetical protein
MFERPAASQLRRIYAMLHYTASELICVKIFCNANYLPQTPKCIYILHIRGRMDTRLLDKAIVIWDLDGTF